MKKILSLIALYILSASVFTQKADALELPEIIGNNMMLQQQNEAKLWGWAKPNATVEVSVSWNQQTYTGKADAKTGKWLIKVNTPAASYDQQTLTIKELAANGKSVAEEVKIESVLIGEVWFCSGQSNMEMTLGGFWNCPVEGANEAIAQSGKYKHAIRHCAIERKGADTPQEKAKGTWKTCEPENAPGFSAVGYFFARTLNDILDIPVGIINCSWGGSCVEGWLPKEILLTYPDGLTPMDDTDYHAKMVMYNGMLYPTSGYTIKGFLWNQGESNVGKEKEYIDRFSTMTRLWRKMWDQPNDKLPIYTVELPPYRYGDSNGDWAAKFRQAQHKIAETLENSGCVGTSDLIYDYEPDQIHGTKKLEIGQRLAYMAAGRDYGVKGIGGEAPEFEYMETIDADKNAEAVIAGSKVEKNPNATGKIKRLYFTNCTDGFDRLADIQGFEAQDVDGTWYPAIVWAGSEWKDVKRQGCFLLLACPQAKEIKNIRYAFKNFYPTILHNLRGLPVVPFSTEQ